MLDNIVNLNIRLRPKRIGFLVDPSNKECLEKVFKINSYLWGGQYNFIIPVWKNLPKNIVQKYGTNDKREIVDMYLQFYQPDMLVEAEYDISESIGLDYEEVSQIEDIITEENGVINYRAGQSVLDIYQYLYKQGPEKSFTHNKNYIVVSCEDEEFNIFRSAAFGSFFKEAREDIFYKTFSEYFSAVNFKLNNENLIDLYKSHSLCPIDLTKYFLKPSYPGHEKPILFILDAFSSEDLIDFWNLKSVHYQVTALPIQWLSKISKNLNDLVLDKCNLWKDSFSDRYFTGLNTIFSSSITEEESLEMKSKYFLGYDPEVLKVSKFDPLVLKRSRTEPKVYIPELTGRNESIDLEIDLDNPVLKFDLLRPEFCQGESGSWANIIKVGVQQSQSHLSTVFPENYNLAFRDGYDNEESLENWDSLNYWSVVKEEGILVLSDEIKDRIYWKIQDGDFLLKKWFERKGFDVELTQSGKATRQIIKTLGGANSIKFLANEKVIRLLDDISNSLTKSMKVDTFRNKLDPISKDAFSLLVEKRAVELGMDLTCTRCDVLNWYPIKSLDYKLNCINCLKDMDFPIKDPKEGFWSYRVVGPFALGKYAEGGYAAALGLCYFFKISGIGQMTWSAGVKLRENKQDKLEADFVIWCPQNNGYNCYTETIFGEAKSFGPVSKDIFDATDIKKMKDLAIEFPDSILVFCTLKEIKDFNENELFMLRDLAEWGRQVNPKTKRSLAPVIVLPGDELFVGTDRRNFSDREQFGENLPFKRVTSVNLRKLADRTQQKYLGMPSYHVWNEVNNIRKVLKIDCVKPIDEAPVKIYLSEGNVADEFLRRFIEPLE